MLPSNDIRPGQNSQISSTNVPAMGVAADPSSEKEKYIKAWQEWKNSAPEGGRESRELAVNGLYDCLQRQAYRLELVNLELSCLPVLPTHITTLDVSHNRLTALPDLPSSLTSLEADENQLTALPASLPERLEILRCDYNLLETLPKTLSSLPLRHLSVSDNRLSALPEGIAHLSGGTINLQRNPLSEQTIKELQSMTATAGYQGPRIYFDMPREITSVRPERLLTNCVADWFSSGCEALPIDFLPESRKTCQHNSPSGEDGSRNTAINRLDGMKDKLKLANPELCDPMQTDKAVHTDKIDSEIIKAFDDKYKQSLPLKEQIAGKYHSIEMCLAIRGRMKAIKSTAGYLQNPTTEKRPFFTLSKNESTGYVLHNQFSGERLTANGKFCFIIPVDEPNSIFLLENDPTSHYGHSSLSRREWVKTTDFLSKKYYLERTLNANKHPWGWNYPEDTYLSGELFFNDGNLVMWNNMSGHYRGAPYNAYYNMSPSINLLLPLDKYIGEFGIQR
ncbi:hypothetical protein I8B79_004646 [Salmonella enterica]|nr:hypothetical protein [Salmonella enterica]EGR8340843.1 hypothetical protein [Salmonella enterica]